MTDKPKRNFALPNMKPRDTVFTPETVGKMKRDPLHMSVDELIEYKKEGNLPPIIIQPGKIEEMAKQGCSVQTICYVLNLSKDTFYKTPAFLTEFQKGRGEIARNVRARIAEKALEEDNLQAMMYIDRTLGGDVETVNLNASVSQRPLEGADTNDLIEVAIKKIHDRNSPSN